jgi:hypothetical protein
MPAPEIDAQFSPPPCPPRFINIGVGTSYPSATALIAGLGTNMPTGNFLVKTNFVVDADLYFVMGNGVYFEDNASMTTSGPVKLVAENFAYFGPCGDFTWAGIVVIDTSVFMETIQ